jgi:hypothetical protein
MIRINGRVRGYGVLAVLLAACGCTHKSQPQKNDALKGEGADTAGVTVSAPELSYSGGLLLIRGTVHADTASAGDIAGRLDFELIGATGQPIRHCTGHPLHSKMVPGDPSRNEPYEMLWDIHPTPDEIVRVHFVDEATAKQEDARESGTPGEY